MKHRCHLGGVFFWERWSTSGLLLAEGLFRNGIPLTARNLALDSVFSSAAQTSNWYLGVIDSDSFTALSDADTMASHAGWQEITAYSQATRPAWGKAAAAASSLNNATLAVFTFSSQKTATGLFVCSNSTKGGTSGNLWATGLGEQSQQMNPGEILRASYALDFSSVN